MPITRRQAMQGIAGSGLLSRAAAQVTPQIMQLKSELEPLAAAIENTPREKCAGLAVDLLRKGTPYRQLLAATFLAGVRNVNPRPPGFALHCLFVIHSAHTLALEAPDDARILPLFYAIDNFKTAQERDAKASTGDYVMRELTGTLPSDPRSEFIKAMDAWDIEGAERASAAMARGGKTKDAFDLLWEYGSRDQRNIGHKAIFPANAFRTLQTIGIQYSEPVLRSIALALLDFKREQQLNGYALDDQCYAMNRKALKQIDPAGWNKESDQRSTMSEILGVLRSAPLDQACSDIAARISKNSVSARSVWDAIHLASAELAMRCSAGNTITGLHGVSSANALHYAYRTATDPATRVMLTLQAAGWMVQFRTFAESRKNAIRDFPILDLEPRDVSKKAGSSVFANLKQKKDESAAQILSIAADPEPLQQLLETAMRHAFLKTDEVHYFKYLAALIEDSRNVSARYRPHMLAAIAYYAKGDSDPETPAMTLAKDALKSLEKAPSVA